MTQRTDFTEATPEEIAAAVSEALRKHGITAVMSGGRCVSVYSENKYHPGPSSPSSRLPLPRQSEFSLRSSPCR